MVEDPIVEEVRHVREALAAKYGFDIKAILAAARKRQAKSGRKTVSPLTNPARRRQAARRTAVRRTLG
ncbi:MAG: hypothetical protein FJY92_09880 [Candidatus Hydrogenedentes bacterium]|nr:hypothetical protein [Candidatus Hydrogenedentota bacterium]